MDWNELSQQIEFMLLSFKIILEKDHEPVGVAENYAERMSVNIAICENAQAYVYMKIIQTKSGILHQLIGNHSLRASQ
jgi:hypothetical protein